VANKLSNLCETLGYQFKDLKNLESALTHRSVKGENNERLEFLGDSIVNFIIAQALFEKFPKAREGKLSRLRANLVNGDTLAELAYEFDLGDFMLLGPGEVKSGGQRRHSILADALEAIIAAIYLDAGLDVCQQCVLSWYETRLADVTKTKNIKDPKTRLQEYIQSQKLALPIYSIATIEGDAHKQTFNVQCQVEGSDFISTGSGSSRRRAEQQAATEYLAHLEKN